MRKMPFPALAFAASRSSRHRSTLGPAARSPSSPSGAQPALLDRASHLRRRLPTGKARRRLHRQTEHRFLLNDCAPRSATSLILLLDRKTWSNRPLPASSRDRVTYHTLDDDRHRHRVSPDPAHWRGKLPVRTSSAGTRSIAGCNSPAPAPWSSPTTPSAKASATSTRNPTPAPMTSGSSARRRSRDGLGPAARRLDAGGRNAGGDLSRSARTFT